MTKEARLIVPKEAADDQSYHELFLRVSRTFGGVTVSEAHGYWEAPRQREPEIEEVFVLDIAYEPTRLNDGKLFSIAKHIGDVFEQKAVYLRYGNGYVQFVDEDSVQYDPLVAALSMEQAL